VLVEDGAGWTRLEAGRRHEGTLAAEKIACATRRSGPRHDAASLGDAEGQHGDEEGGAGEAAQRQGGLVTVKPVAQGGHRGTGTKHVDGTGARRRVAARSCLMLSEACRGSARPRDAAQNRGTIGDGGRHRTRTRRHRRNALRPASRRLGWGLVERRWSSRTSVLGRCGRDGEGGTGGVGAHRSAALATNEEKGAQARLGVDSISGSRGHTKGPAR
jgi:hypothetical protein